MFKVNDMIQDIDKNYSTYLNLFKVININEYEYRLFNLNDKQEYYWGIEAINKQFKLINSKKSKLPKWF